MSEEQTTPVATSSSVSSPVTKVFIGGLFRLTTEPMVAKYFSQVGKVKNVTLVLDKETGESRGFGFVEFDSEDAAKRAIAELNDSTLDKRRIKVSLPK